MPSSRVDNDTFIHRARRAQLIETAIGVIADVGTERATISRIAEAAGVTRGVVTYHFRDRPSLLAGVVTYVYDRAREVLENRVQSASTPRESLREFITGSIDFYGAYPTEMTALSAIYRSPDMPRSDRVEHRTEMTDVEDILIAGIRSGDFRRLDPAVTSATIRAGLDAALVRIREGADLEHEKREVWSLFDAATRRAGSGPAEPHGRRDPQRSSDAGN